MSGYRCQIHALAVSAAMLLVAGEASAQYCDPRFDPSCRAYPPQGYPPQISPQPSGVARQSSGRRCRSPVQTPLRVAGTVPSRAVDPALRAIRGAVRAVGGEPHPIWRSLSDIDPEYRANLLPHQRTGPAQSSSMQNRFSISSRAADGDPRGVGVAGKVLAGRAPRPSTTNRNGRTGIRPRR